MFLVGKLVLSPSQRRLCVVGRLARGRLTSKLQPVILLQIVMVSPGTHLVKKHESLSITNESHFKKTGSPKLKMPGPLCNQTVNLETNAKTLYYTEFIEIKYSPSVYLK